MKIKKITLIILIVLLFMLGLLYTGLAYYYVHPFSVDNNGQGFKYYAPNENSFIYGTVINGVYSTGKTSADVNRILSEVELDNIEIHINDETYVIDSKAVNLGVDYKKGLDSIISAQKPLLWIKNAYGDNGKYNINPEFYYDEKLFIEAFDALSLETVNPANNDVYIELTDDGYVLVDNKIPVLDVDLLKNRIKDELLEGLTDFVVDDSYYINYEYSSDDIALINFFEELDAAQSRLVKYKFGSEYKSISAYDWDILLSVDDNLVKRFDNYNLAKKAFDFDIDNEKAIAYIDEFLDEYNTYNNRYFKGHNGKWVYVQKGNYGNKIDISKEEEWFVDFINSSVKKITREPQYLIEAPHKEKNDFGDTFIEISIDEQYMWYYVDGEVYVETPITSGSLANGGTAPRVVYVYSKIPNKWLNGPTWHSFVKYWVAIQGAIGIHDASWRSVYGGTEYLYNGSHGCINTPAEAMKKIFDNVEIGTPVIVYSIEKNGVDDRD